MFPTKQDYAYWSARKAPQWAGPVEPVCIHRVINSHAPRLNSACYQTIKDMKILRLLRYQPEPMAEVARIAINSGRCYNAKRRAGNFRRWFLRWLERGGNFYSLPRDFRLYIYMCDALNVSGIITRDIKR